MKTIQEMIEVMQAYEEGKQIQCKVVIMDCTEWLDANPPKWNWQDCDYRIKPERKVGGRMTNEVRKAITRLNKHGQYNLGTEDWIALNVLIDAVEEAEPVRHGHWDYPYKNDINQCSICGFYVQDKINNVHTMYKFCPNCGAKMDEVEK